MINEMYHVSPRINDRSIRVHGIDPRFHKGRREACYYVDADKVGWAILHCADRHGVSPHELLVYRVQVSRAALTRTNMEGVYYTSVILFPFSASAAMALIDPDRDDPPDAREFNDS